MSPPKRKLSLRAAIRQIGVRVLAARLGITREAVVSWRVVPPKRVLELEPLFLPLGLDRHDMNPDVFGPRPRAKRQAFETAAL